MKRQIRNGVFETNSSSMHSLVVMKCDEKYTSKEFSEGIYLLRDKETGEEECAWEPWSNDMEFGRSPFMAIGTFKDKWLYACASLVREYNDDTYKELVEIAKKYVPGLKRIRLPMTIRNKYKKDYERYKDDEYVQKYWLTEEELFAYLAEKEKQWELTEDIEYWGKNGFWCYREPFTGYVDEDILSGFLEKENISIEEFLTNKKYIVIQDGDEYCIYQDMKECGLINMDKIDHEYPEYNE